MRYKLGCLAYVQVDLEVLALANEGVAADLVDDAVEVLLEVLALSLAAGSGAGFLLALG